MPKKKNESQSVETEKGFGTGLRVKLEGRRGEPADPVAETEAEPNAEETSEPTETEQLWAELEEALAREDELRQTLAERSESDQKTIDLERTLAARAEALEERERKLAAEVKTLQEESKRPQTKPKVPRGRTSALAHLRKRADEHAEQVWKVFQEALIATMPDGQPDFRTRLSAAATLLEETYGTASRQLTPGEQVEAARDELAGLRAARTAGKAR